MSLVYGLESGGPAVIFNDDVIAMMARYRQKTFKDKEAGGQLFARFEGGSTIIVEATEPNPLDKRARYGFIPNRWIQRLEIKSLHKRGKHFVGDWHTHPQPVPVPSGDDKRNMIECFSQSRHELKAFLMVIVGTAELPKGLLVCLVNREGVSRLNLIS